MTAPNPRPFVAVQRWALTGIFVILSVGALKLGRPLLLPIAVSALFALLLAKPVRWLSRGKLPNGLAAGIVVLGAVATFAITVYVFAAPAASWVARAPRTLEAAEAKVQRLLRPLESLQRTAEKVEEITSTGDQPSVKIEQRGLMSRLSGTTTGFLTGFFTVVFLTFFLLAQGERFRDQVGEFLHRRHHTEVQDALRDMQGQMSTYLFTASAINAGVGLATFGIMVAVGMPNPGLWGLMAGVLNFIPYIGAIATLIVIGLAGIVSFDTTTQPLMAVGAFFVVNLIEANVITPMLMGRRLPLNPVAVFVGFLFWGWVWGITGAVLAVPLTVLIKVIADRVPSMQPIGVLLDS